MENLHTLAERKWLERHIDSLKNIAEFHYEHHRTAWKAFYERDFSTQFYGGSLMSHSGLTPTWIAAMQHYVDLGLAPTPEQVGARHHLVVWADRLYKQTGDAAAALLKRWSKDLDDRLAAARKR